MSDNSSQNLLPRTILVGFMLLLAGVLFALLVFVPGLPVELYIFAFILIIIGLFFLVAAWHIRQGLIHGRLVGCVACLMHLPKIIKQKFKK
jgi:hypothetical protein